MRREPWTARFYLEADRVNRNPTLVRHMDFLKRLIILGLVLSGIVFLIWLLAKILEWYALSHPRFCVRCGEEVWPSHGQVPDSCPQCRANGPGAFENGWGARRFARGIRLHYLLWQQAERELGHRITDPEFDWWLLREEAKRESGHEPSTEEEFDNWLAGKRENARRELKYATVTDSDLSSWLYERRRDAERETS